MKPASDRRLCPWIAVAALCACACQAEPAKKAPPLAGMEEPLALLDEPDDEAQRAALEPGSFTGIYVADARASLDALLEEPEGVRVERVVENSPGESAGLVAGDLILAARPGAGEERDIRWPSEWRALELELEPGAPLRLLVDRAGSERTAELVTVARVHPAVREPVARLREEERVGVVLRGATEVEARAAGLAPGGGAVVVGLSTDSPWRKAGIVFEDLIVAIDGDPVAAPELVIDRVRSQDSGDELDLEIVRAGERVHVEVPVSRRASEFRHFAIPLIVSYEKERGSSTCSLLLGLFRLRRTPAAWDMRLLWFISFGGGDSDRLEELRY